MNDSQPSSVPDPVRNEATAPPIAVMSPVSAIEAILRNPRALLVSLAKEGGGKILILLAATAVGCSLVYGLVIGTFSGGTQLWAAPAKVCGGLGLSALICMPSLFIFCWLSGARFQPLQIVGLIAGLVSIMTVLLIGFAPVAWIFSQSTESVVSMGALHLTFWSLSIYFGMRFLFIAFDELKIRTSAGVNIWIVMFLLVMLQMTTALRPIIGTSATLLPGEKKFFVNHWMDSIAGEKSPRQRVQP